MNTKGHNKHQKPAEFPFELKDINGHEIIAYLNEKSSINLVFESQRFRDREDDPVYQLYFETIYNNWGTDQPITGNCIYIDKTDVWVGMDEPFDGGYEEEELEDLLKAWLPTHTFTNNTKELYTNLMQDIQDDMVLIYEPDPETTPANIDEIIEKLQKAKSYIK